MRTAKTTRTLAEKALRKFVNVYLNLIQKSIDERLLNHPLLNSVMIFGTEFNEALKANGYSTVTFFPYDVLAALKEKGYTVEEKKDGSNLVWVTISW